MSDASVIVPTSAPASVAAVDGVVRQAQALALDGPLGELTSATVTVEAMTQGQAMVAAPRFLILSRTSSAILAIYRSMVSRLRFFGAKGPMAELYARAYSVLCFERIFAGGRQWGAAAVSPMLNGVTYAGATGAALVVGVGLPFAGAFAGTLCALKVVTDTIKSYLQPPVWALGLREFRLGVMHTIQDPATYTHFRDCCLHLTADILADLGEFGLRAVLIRREIRKPLVTCMLSTYLTMGEMSEFILAHFFGRFEAFHQVVKVANDQVKWLLVKQKPIPSSLLILSNVQKHVISPFESKLIYDLFGEGIFTDFILYKVPSDELFTDVLTCIPMSIYVMLIDMIREQFVNVTLENDDSSDQDVDPQVKKTDDGFSLNPLRALVAIKRRFGNLMSDARLRFASVSPNVPSNDESGNLQLSGEASLPADIKDYVAQLEAKRDKHAVVRRRAHEQSHVNAQAHQDVKRKKDAERSGHVAGAPEGKFWSNYNGGYLNEKEKKKEGGRLSKERLQRAEQAATNLRNYHQAFNQQRDKKWFGRGHPSPSADDRSDRSYNADIYKDEQTRKYATSRLYTDDDNVSVGEAMFYNKTIYDARLANDLWIEEQKRQEMEGHQDADNYTAHNEALIDYVKAYQVYNECSYLALQSLAEEELDVLKRDVLESMLDTARNPMPTIIEPVDVLEHAPCNEVNTAQAVNYNRVADKHNGKKVYLCRVHVREVFTDGESRILGQQRTVTVSRVDDLLVTAGDAFVEHSDRYPSGISEVLRQLKNKKWELRFVLPDGSNIDPFTLTSNMLLVRMSGACINAQWPVLVGFNLTNLKHSKRLMESLVPLRAKALRSKSLVRHIKLSATTHSIIGEPFVPEHWHGLITGQYSAECGDCGSVLVDPTTNVCYGVHVMGFEPKLNAGRKFNGSLPFSEFYGWKSVVGLQDSVREKDFIKLYSSEKQNLARSVCDFINKGVYTVLEYFKYRPRYNKSVHCNTRILGVNWTNNEVFLVPDSAHVAASALVGIRGAQPVFNEPNKPLPPLMLRKVYNQPAICLGSEADILVAIDFVMNNWPDASSCGPRDYFNCGYGVKGFTSKRQINDDPEVREKVRMVAYDIVRGTLLGEKPLCPVGVFGKAEWMSFSKLIHRATGITTGTVTFEEGKELPIDPSQHKTFLHSCRMIQSLEAPHYVAIAALLLDQNFKNLDDNLVNLNMRNGGPFLIGVDIVKTEFSDGIIKKFQNVAAGAGVKPKEVQQCFEVDVKGWDTSLTHRMITHLFTGLGSQLQYTETQSLAIRDLVCAQPVFIGEELHDPEGLWWPSGIPPTLAGNSLMHDMILLPHTGEGKLLKHYALQGDDLLAAVNIKPGDNNVDYSAQIRAIYESHGLKTKYVKGVEEGYTIVGVTIDTHGKRVLNDKFANRREVFNHFVDTESVDLYNVVVECAEAGGFHGLVECIPSNEAGYAYPRQSDNNTGRFLGDAYTYLTVTP